MDIPDELKSGSKLPYWETLLPNKRRSGQPSLNSDSPAAPPVSSPTMATQRNRARGPRGNGPEAGEEAAVWSQSQDELRKISRILLRAEECREEFEQLEKEYVAKGRSKLSPEEIDKLSALHREQVKLCEEVSHIASGGGSSSTLIKLDILKGMVSHNEESKSEPTRRGGIGSRDNARERSALAMDLDGAADSPTPSPMVIDKPLRKDRGAGRSSLPPKDSPHTQIKQESVEASSSAANLPTPTTEINTNPKGKITFAMGAEVAFRPKATPGSEEPEWIQGVVVKIIGEGKSRRYDVQDPEPDEVTKKPGQVYRTSASSMVTIPPLGQPLADYPKGKGVLARYPDTTTFYRAEVVGMNGKMVILKFEGEEDTQVTMEVDRRFVLDHRG